MMKIIHEFRGSGTEADPFVCPRCGFTWLRNTPGHGTAFTGSNAHELGENQMFCLNPEEAAYEIALHILEQG